MISKHYIEQLATYNVWANELMSSWLEQLSDSQWTQPQASSFASIQETTLHIMSAENLWLERFKKVATPAWMQASYQGTKAAHLATWKKISDNLLRYVQAFDESLLLEPLTFKRLTGEEYTMPYYQLMAHVFNHSTYHRGQLVTLLRQVGFTSVQSTDLFLWYKKYGSKS